MGPMIFAGRERFEAYLRLASENHVLLLPTRDRPLRIVQQAPARLRRYRVPDGVSADRRTRSGRRGSGAGGFSKDLAKLGQTATGFDERLDVPRAAELVFRQPP